MLLDNFVNKLLYYFKRTKINKKLNLLRSRHVARLGYFGIKFKKVQKMFNTM